MQPKELARLLSGRNEPSVLEKEALWAQTVGAVGSRPPRGGRWAMLIAALASLAAGATAVVLLRHQTATGWMAGDFESRGSGPGVPSLRLSCIDGAKEAPCAIGRTLTFEVTQLPPAARFFAAFARRSDGVVIWYFPPAEGRSEPIDPSRPILSQAVRLGPPHLIGEYDVFAIFTPTAQTRAEIKAIMEPQHSESRNGVLVIERHMALREEP